MEVHGNFDFGMAMGWKGVLGDEWAGEGTRWWDGVGWAWSMVEIYKMVYM